MFMPVRYPPSAGRTGLGTASRGNAATSRQIFGIADLEAERRWPRFTASIDVAEAFALLVKLAKQQNDSIETVAREGVGRKLGRDRDSGPAEPAGDKPYESRVSAQRVSDDVGAAGP